MNLTGTPRNLPPRYNIAPGQEVAVVRGGADERRLSMLRWGLIPGWARDPSIAYKLINARSETVSEKPSFRSAYRRRRCLIPTDGFYEWTRRGKARQPWLIAMADLGVFAFAGLWEQWRVPEGARFTEWLTESRPGDAVETCTILTCPPNAVVERVHARMPAILPPHAYDSWLDGKDVPLDPYPAEEMTIHAVSTRVNKPANDDPTCVEPVLTV